MPIASARIARTEGRNNSEELRCWGTIKRSRLRRKDLKQTAIQPLSIKQKERTREIGSLSIAKFLDIDIYMQGCFRQ